MYLVKTSDTSERTLRTHISLGHSVDE